jgi:peptidylprolyl isomerase
MGTEKRQRQKEGRQARIAAAEAAQRKAATRQRIVSFAGLAALIVLLIVGISYFTRDDKKSSDTVASTDTSVADLSSTTTLAALESAAGKPCVALADPLPAGAPNVPVVVGPPPTELIKQDLIVGTGAEVAAGDTVTVNYIGVACSTGTIFDSSYQRNQPATFSLDQVIEGWTNGIPGMKVGGQRLLGIPSDQAYKSTGSAQGGIAPDEALWFVVEVTNTVPSSTTTTAGTGTTTSTVAAG